MRFFLYICFVISLVACSTTPSNSFKLDGFVDGAKDSENIILCYFSLKNGEWYEIADTTKIINGKFLFEGNIEELTAADLCFDDANVVIDARIYLEPTSMKLRIDKNQPYAYKLSGTNVEKENIELRKEMEPYAKIRYKGLEYCDSTIKQIKLHDNNLVVRDSLINNLHKYFAENTVGDSIIKTYLDFIKKHNTYRIVPDLLYLLTKDSIPLDTIQSIYSHLPEQSKTSFMGKLVCKQIEYIKSKKNTSVGNLAPDFTRNDFSGKTIRLSDFKNEDFILLDFWASWCAPCIKEIPKIKKIFNKYHEESFTIISISSDTDSSSWINAINKYQLEAWPQILSNKKDNDSSIFNIDDIATIYEVNAIPHFILIDKQGKIIARWGYLGEEQLVEIDRILNRNFSNIE